jgi:hypothetical protein
MKESNLENIYIIDNGLKPNPRIQFDSAKIAEILSGNTVLNFENCHVEIHVYNDCLKIKSSTEPRVENKNNHFEQLSSK